MLQEREFEHTFQGWQDAVSFLTRIGKYSPYFQTLPMDTVIAEANHIKQNQQILTEDA